MKLRFLRKCVVSADVYGKPGQVMDVREPIARELILGGSAEAVTDDAPAQPKQSNQKAKNES
jgi:hypothetical protein